MIDTSTFEYESVWRVLVQFRVVYCANFFNIGQLNGLTWKTWLTNQLFEYETLRQIHVKFDFRKNAWVTGHVIFQRVGITTPTMISNVSEWVLFVHDLNWQVRRSCQVSLRLWVSIWNIGTEKLSARLDARATQKSRKKSRSYFTILSDCFLLVSRNFTESRFDESLQCSFRLIPHHCSLTINHDYGFYVQVSNNHENPCSVKMSRAENEW